MFFVTIDKKMRPFLLSLFCVFSWGQEKPREFHFSSPDEKLLSEANAMDAVFEKKGLTYRDGKAEAYLERVGAELVADSPPPERVVYKFRLLRDPMMNAFALPNGSIYVNTGLAAAVENEAELASVLSHEITHVVNRHSYLQNRSIRKKVVTIEIIGLAAAIGGSATGRAIYAISASAGAEVSEVLIVSSIYGYSRELESEADATGYARLIHADYDGAAMARSFEILDERLEFEPVEPFWRTHPKLEQRIAASKKLVERQNALHPRDATTDDYLKSMADLMRYNIGLDLDSRRPRTAVERAERLVKWSPDARDCALAADSYRGLGAKTARAEGDELARAGKKEQRKLTLKRTEEEEQKALLATAQGKEALASNRAKAESLYKEALATDSGFAPAHRGLGMLYQDEARRAEAASEYRRYLDLAPKDALDRLRIERRFAAMTAAQ